MANYNKKLFQKQVKKASQEVMMNAYKLATDITDEVYADILRAVRDLIDQNLEYFEERHNKQKDGT